MVPKINIGACRDRARGAGFALICLLGGLFASTTSAQTGAHEANGAAAQRGPRMQVVEPELHFGEVRRGETIEAVFEIRNSGDEPLKILRVQPG